jgi:hypothetical protein
MFVFLCIFKRLKIFTSLKLMKKNKMNYSKTVLASILYQSFLIQYPANCGMCTINNLLKNDWFFEALYSLIWIQQMSVDL